jgi:hypothetical protein
MKTSQHESAPDEVDHWTPFSHWCAGCWHWVIDCEHLLDPLPIKHHAVQDGCVRSLAYDRETQCLEVRFKWKSVQQYRPVSLQTAGEIWKTRPVNVSLDNLVIKSRRIRFDEVRSEGKLLMSMLRGWRILEPQSGL